MRLDVLGRALRVGIPPLVPSLEETRQRVAASLDQQVEQLVSEPQPERLRLLSAKELRGWPAVGPLSAGSAISGTEPGSDEHLERLDHGPLVA